MDNILKQLGTNLLLSQKSQQYAANLHKTPASAYQIKDQV